MYDPLSASIWISKQVPVYRPFTIYRNDPNFGSKKTETSGTKELISLQRVSQKVQL